MCEMLYLPHFIHLSQTRQPPPPQKKSVISSGNIDRYFILDTYISALSLHTHKHYIKKKNIKSLTKKDDHQQYTWWIWFRITVVLVNKLQVGSRTVVLVAGFFMAVLGCFGKFTSVIAALPDPITGGSFMVLFGRLPAINCYFSVNSSLFSSIDVWIPHTILHRSVFTLYQANPVSSLL